MAKAKKRKVWVTAWAGRYVPGLGTRKRGECFEVDEETGEKLLGLFGFSDRDPNREEKGPEIEAGDNLAGLEGDK